MSAHVMCLTSSGGIPLFVRKKGDGNLMTFSKMASLNGVHMFLKTLNVELVNTDMTDAMIVWKEFKGCITLIAIANGTTKRIVDNFLDAVFSAMIFIVGLKDIEQPRSIERLKRDLRSCYYIIDRLLECLNIGNRTGTKTDLIDLTDCFISSENHLLQIADFPLTMAKQKKKVKKQSKKKKVNSKVKKRSKRMEKNYTVEDIQEALKSVKEGKSLREAASSTAVPKSTLFRIMKGRTQIDCKKGAPSVLTTDEEEDIVKWILYCAERGFPVNKKQLLDTVKNYVNEAGRKNPFTDDRPGKKWYSLFMKRHSNLSIRTAQNLTTTRASVCESDLRKWFKKLEDYLQKKNLLTLDPKRVFNLDESCFMLVPPKNESVIAKIGARAIYKVVSGSEKSNLTVLFTAAASGKLLPPMILFDLKTTPRKEVLEKIPSDWAVANTEKGWMTSDSFYKYIVNVFYKWLVDNKYEFPVILYADDHSSHLTMQLANFCQEKEIELIGLYPNSTHIIQPLDVGLFHVLKEKYKVANDSWRIQNNIVDVKKCMFAGILKQTLESYDFTNCIVSGFRASGLVPFNPNAVQYNVLNKRIKTKQNLVTNDAEEIASDSSAVGCNETFLQKFEKDVLSPNILHEFEQHEFNESWTGDIKLEGLFECWKKMRNISDNANKVNEDNSLIDIVHVHEDVSGSTESDFNIKNLNIVDCEIVLEHDLVGNEVNDLKESANSLHVIENSVVIATPIEALSVQENSVSQDVRTCFEELNTQITASVEAHQSFSMNEDILNNYDKLTPRDSLTSTSKSFFPTSRSDVKDSSIQETDDKSNQSVKEEQLFDNEHCTINDLVAPTSEDNSLIISKIVSPTNSIVNEKSIFTNQSADASNTITDFATNQSLNISQEMLKIVRIPQFQPKRKKVHHTNETTVNTVEKVLETFQKKENEKILKQTQIELNKKKKEEKKFFKDKELIIVKSFQEKKKELTKRKQDFNLKIKVLKRSVKNESNKENLLLLKEQIKTSINQLDGIERELVSIEVQCLQSKLKIKQEAI